MSELRGFDAWLTREPDDRDDYPDDYTEDDVTDTTSQLAAALCKAQAQIRGAAKDATNPHFQSRYADLASVWEACRKPLTDNGLSVVQFTRYHADLQGFVLVTKLLHVSGESEEGITPLLTGKGDMQALGSAITYARRYGLAAMVGVAPDDDDGNAAVAEGSRVEKVKTAKAPAGYDAWVGLLQAAAVRGAESLREVFKNGTKPQRDYLDPAMTAKLKALADEADAAKPTDGTVLPI